jgi:membrane protein DedA with SNARE-associated domain
VASAGEVTLGNVIGFTVFGGTVGAATAYVIGRVARRPRLTFLTVALIALAGYAVVPFNAAESLETATWLNVFHVVVAIPAIGMLTRYLPKDRTSAEA